MSIQAVAAVLECEDAPGGSEGLALISLANHADENWQCWPSYERIGREAKVSRRQAITLIGKLVEHEWIEVRKEAGPKVATGSRLNLYVLNAERLRVKSSAPFEPPKGEVQRTQRVKPTSPEPSGNHQEDLTPLAKKRHDRDELFDAIATLAGMDPSNVGNQGSRIGKVRRDIKALNDDVTADEIYDRAAKYASLFPKATFTIEALAKHWPALGQDRPPGARGAPTPTDIMRRYAGS